MHSKVQADVVERRTQPIECTLSDIELDDRRAGWEALGGAIAGRERTAGGFRVHFQPEPGLSDALHSLVASERQCCGWASWTVFDHHDVVVLEVTGPAPQIDNLAGMFGV